MCLRVVVYARWCLFSWSTTTPHTAGSDDRSLNPRTTAMDEGTLNDLLECSVCLERLDTSSKVLPCQHTFCKKCLENIVDKHKELRCPECRILVPIKIEELPPNVLLMRILEGMKNATPKVQQHRGSKGVQPVPQQQQQQQIVGTPDHRGGSNKQNLQHPVQPYAKALYDYASKTPGWVCCFWGFVRFTGDNLFILW